MKTPAQHAATVAAAIAAFVASENQAALTTALSAAFTAYDGDVGGLTSLATSLQDSVDLYQATIGLFDIAGSVDLVDDLPEGAATGEAWIVTTGAMADRVFLRSGPRWLDLFTLLKGATGAAATIAVGEVTTLPAGEAATVTNVGDEGAAVLDFAIPQGAAATVTVGDVSTLAPGEPATVTNTGTAEEAVLDFAIPQGAAATVAVGDVTTLAAGEPATVTNVGDDGAAVLDFAIPQGAAATIAVGGVTTLAAGEPATVTNTGTAEEAVLDFAIPQGAAATLTVGDVTTLAAGEPATVTNTGTAEEAVLDFAIPQGAAATVAIGDVTTLAAGEPATVTNTGTAEEAVLDFAIPEGAAATIAVGDVTTLAAGEAATVTNTGTAGEAVLNFALPQGRAATITVGEVTALAAGEPATVTNTGTAEEAVLDFGLPKGDAATVTVGDVTTLEPGEPATVTNVGDSADAVLDFAIPRGAAATITVGAVTTLAPGAPATVTNVGTPGEAVLDFALPAGQDGEGVGDMIAANNLSDLDDIAVARTNIGLAIGTDVQAHSAGLDALAGRAIGAAASTDILDRAAADGRYDRQSDTIAASRLTGTIDVARLPAIAITDSWEVGSQAAMLALTAQRGDVAIRTDENKTYVLSTDDPTALANWKWMKTPTDLVLSVAGITGAVTASALRAALALAIADVSGLQTALDAKQTASAILAALAGTGGGANKLAYFNGASTMALTDLTSFGRSLIACADQAAAQTLIGAAGGGDIGDVVWTFASSKGASWKKADGSVINKASYSAFAAINGSPIDKFTSNSVTSTVATIGAGTAVNHIIKAGSLWIANTSGGRIYTSPDLASWTLQATLGTNYEGLLAYDGSKVVCIGGGSPYVAYSSDLGSTWTSRGIDAPLNARGAVVKLISGPGVILTVSGNNGGAVRYLCSTVNGGASFAASITLYVSASADRPVFGDWTGSQFSLVFGTAGGGTESATFIKSTTGLSGSWTSVSVPGTGQLVGGGMALNKFYVDRSGETLRYTEDNGATWLTFGSVASGNGDIFELAGNAVQFRGSGAFALDFDQKVAAQINSGLSFVFYSNQQIDNGTGITAFPAASSGSDVRITTFKPFSYDLTTQTVLPKLSSVGQSNSQIGKSATPFVKVL